MTPGQEELLVLVLIALPVLALLRWGRPRKRARTFEVINGDMYLVGKEEARR